MRLFVLNNADFERNIVYGVFWVALIFVKIYNLHSLITHISKYTQIHQYFWAFVIVFGARKMLNFEEKIYQTKFPFCVHASGKVFWIRRNTLHLQYPHSLIKVQKRLFWTFKWLLNNSLIILLETIQFLKMEMNFGKFHNHFCSETDWNQRYHTNVYLCRPFALWWFLTVQS